MSGSFPAAPLDLVPLLLREVSNQQIYAVIELQGHLDASRLSQAISALLQQHPMLRYTLAPTDNWPQWQPLPAEARNTPVVHIRPEHELQQHMATHQPKRGQAAFEVSIFRGQFNDTLCLAVDHTLSDAAGVKILAYHLAAAYRQAAAAGCATMVVNDRDLRSICRSLTPLQKLRALSRPPFRTANWHFPTPHATALNVSDYRWRTFPTHPSARRSSDKHAASINDLLLCSLIAGLEDSDYASDSRKRVVQFTVDLRRYLPAHHNSVANLSGNEHLSFRRPTGESIGDLLQAVTAGTRRIKSNHPGIGSALLTAQVLRHCYTRQRLRIANLIAAGKAAQRANPILSNFGIICAQQLHFGAPAVRHAYIATPSLLAPGLMVGASSFRAQLTVSAGFNSQWISADQVAAVLRSMQRHFLRAQKTRPAAGSVETIFAARH